MNVYKKVMTGELSLFSLTKRMKKKICNRSTRHRINQLPNRHDRSIERLLLRGKYRPKDEHYIGFCADDFSFHDL